MRLHTIILQLSIVLILLITSCSKITYETESLQPVGITPTKIVTNIPTIISTNTVTIIPTLPEDEARTQLLGLLANNGNCRLPCLWGITPGKSKSIEAQEILTAFNSISVLTNFGSDGGSITTWYTEDSLILSSTVGFNSENSIVRYLTFRGEEYKETADGLLPIYDSETFGKRLRPYMLTGILSEFGEPALVVVHTSGQHITGSGGFEILLLYPDEGIFARYTTQRETVGNDARGCLANAQVELRLYPSGDANAYYESLKETTWGGMFDGPILMDNPSWKSVEKVTNMSLTKFYETFREPTDKCIETPANLWFIPES